MSTEPEFSSSASAAPQLEQQFDAAAASKKIRPQSTIARAFSDQLNDAFLINDDLDQLASTIEQKKQSVSYQSTELQLLEARIRQAEQELQEKQRRLGLPRTVSSPAGSVSGSPTAHQHPSSLTPGSSGSGLPPRTSSRPQGSSATGGRERDYVVIEKTPSIVDQRRESQASLRTTGSNGGGYEAPVRAPPPPPSAVQGVQES